MTEAPFYYWYFICTGRELLAETLGDPHPFTLPGATIVERVLSAGYTPVLDEVRRTPFLSADTVAVFERDEHMFLVSIDVAAETIAVQE